MLYFLDVAVYVEHLQDLPSASNPVPFERILFNTGGHYNDAIHQLILPKGGIYFVRLVTIITLFC